MTQRHRRRRRKMGRRMFLLGLGAAACGAVGYALYRADSPAAADESPAEQPESEPNPALPAGEWRAMWVSYLEWLHMDFSSEAAFRAGAGQLMDNCARTKKESQN